MISFNEYPSESSPQLPTKEDVVSVFKKYGQFSQEALDVFNSWFKNRQKESEESEDQYAGLKFNLEVAELCYESDLITEARKYCNQAWKIMNDKTESNSMDITQEFKDLNYDLLEVSDKIDRKIL